MKTLSSLIALLLITSNLFACQLDTDCATGRRCFKSKDDLFGVCKDRPKKSRRAVPKEILPDIDDMFGNTCKLQADCGARRRCVKPAGEVYGVCQ